MALPKRRSSRARRDKRRSQIQLRVPALTRDPETGEVGLAHRVSPSGRYRGQQVRRATDEK